MRALLVAGSLLLAGATTRADEAWGGKPVWVASTVAKLYDISPDGKRFLYADGRKLGVFDRAAGKMVWQIDNTTLHSAKFSPNGRTIVAGEWQNGLNLYDATDGKQLHSFVPAGNERIWQATFRADGTVLYSSSHSGDGNAPPWTMSYTIVHWDPVARKEIGRVSDSFKYEKSNVWLWHRGGGFHLERLTALKDETPPRQTVSYADPLTGKATPTITLDTDDSVFDLSPDGKALLVRAVGKDPRVLDTGTGKLLLTLGGHKRFATAGHKRLVTNGKFSPDGKLIATVTGTAPSNYDRVRTRVDSPDGPAELVVWDAVTGKELSRSEFPTSELDFVEVHFSPDSKFLVALSRDAKDQKERKLVAFGQLPFDAKGGAELNFPKDDELKPKPIAVAPKGPGVVADPLDKFVEELAKSTKATNEKIDLLFVALLGRFATQTEHKRIREKYTGAYTLPVLQAISEEIAATPEFDAHIKSLEKRRPAKPALKPGDSPYPPFGPDYPGWPNFPPSPLPKKP